MYYWIKPHGQFRGISLYASQITYYDQDLDIDGADFLTLQRGFGLGTTLAEDDTNLDEAVDAADLATWLAQYASVPDSGAAAVSEPSALVCVTLAAITLSFRLQP